MIHVNFDTFIAGKPDVIFDRLADIPGYSNWLPQSNIFTRSSYLDNSSESGSTRFRDVTKAGNFDGEITEFIKPVKIKFRQRLHWFGIPVMESRPGYFLKSVQGGTRLYHRAEGRLFGLFRILEPIISIIANRERRRVVQALKRNIELAN